MKTIAIDTETATRHRSSLCQVSLILVGEHPINLFSILVQPPDNEYEWRNTDIHNIDSALTKDAPTLDMVWPFIEIFLQGAKIIAHNASFDLSVLNKSLDFYDIKPISNEVFCTYKATGKKLLEACKEFDVDLSNHHDAAFDALACAKLYMNLGNKESQIPKRRKKVEYFSENRLSGDILKQDLTLADPESYFYNKKVVFTGVMTNIERKDAAIIVKRLGADIQSGISKFIDFVICGNRVGPKKMELIEHYNALGSNIIKLSEEEFLEILRNEN
jgi:DNA polymerase-3 subunit epsilon